MLKLATATRLPVLQKIASRRIEEARAAAEHRNEVARNVSSARRRLDELKAVPVVWRPPVDATKDETRPALMTTSARDDAVADTKARIASLEPALKLAEAENDAAQAARDAAVGLYADCLTFCREGGHKLPPNLLLEGADPMGLADISGVVR